MKDDNYRQHDAQIKMGFEADSEASKKLHQALNAGQKGKKGLGFKKEKKRKKSKKEKNEELLKSLYNEPEDKKKLITDYKDMIRSIETENYKIEERELYGKNKVNFYIYFRINILLKDESQDLV